MHTAYGLGCGKILWDGSLCVETVNAISMKPSITRCVYHNFPRACTAPSSRSPLLCSQNLMENLTGSNNRSEFQLISLMTKQFLIKALKHSGIISNEVVPAALAYLAAIYFPTSEYEEATSLCSAVLMDQTPQEDKETLNARCLLFFDDIAIIVGLCVLQKHIIENSLHYINKRLYLDLRLSPEAFAQYVCVLFAEKTSKERLVERLVVQTYIYPASEDDPMRCNLQDQYAFRPTGSTTAAIIAILQTVSDLLNTNDYVIIISLDFSKAFDTVRHSTLAIKLAQLQVPDNIYNWLAEYLMDKKHAI